VSERYRRPGPDFVVVGGVGFQDVTKAPRRTPPGTRAIQLYLGHKSIQHTFHYTELAADRFKDFWKD
jgi:integrase